MSSYFHVGIGECRAKKLFTKMISPPEDVLYKKTEIFNSLGKHTQTSNPKHHDLIMDLHSTHPSCHSFSGSNGTTVLQLDLDYSHPSASDISLANWNFSEKFKSKLPSGLPCISFPQDQYPPSLPCCPILFPLFLLSFLLHVFFPSKNVNTLSLEKIIV